MFRRSQGVYRPGVWAFIRGIGQHDTSQAQESVVAFFVVAVCYPLLFGSMFDLLDLDHVEVLRLPTALNTGVGIQAFGSSFAIVLST